MSHSYTRKVKYTGKEKTSSLIDNGAPVVWKPGEVKDVADSKVNNLIKYPYFELDGFPKAESKKKSKSEEKREKIQAESKK